MTLDRALQGPDALEDVARRLVRVSEHRAAPPFSRIDFPGALDPTRPVFPSDLISLYGHPVLETMPEPVRWQLGLLETVNFFSLNIHGEQALVGVLAERLYRERSTGESSEVSRYLQHFIHEENAHTYMLAEFCHRYHGRVMPEVVFRFEAPKLSRKGNDLLFFSRVYVLETFLDFVNRRAMRDDTLEPTARAIHRSHHMDETRHMAFDRAIIARLAAELRTGGAVAELQAIASLIAGYADYAFSRLVNPRVYRALELPNPLELMRSAEQSPHRAALKARWWSQPLAFFCKSGLSPTTLGVAPA
ncbi:diiron oxygenase [Ideonella sp. A 288]|uniref:diiron oxygenase n=1 Tax=Ideonella sp. A 288 TaxID=1962181 RepID=UPI0013036A20|nr:diiron oxygenase [Ideonella sp. A 288]